MIGNMIKMVMRRLQKQKNVLENIQEVVMNKRLET